MMTDDIKQLIPIIQGWAATVPYPIKIYLYGSRINGTPSPDSDLDMALEFLDHEDIENRMLLWFRHHDYWTKQLSRILPYPPQLCLYDGNAHSEPQNFLTTREHCLIFDSGNGLSEKEG
jgi:predicted nucleotidyltransferase